MDNIKVIILLVAVGLVVLIAFLIDKKTNFIAKIQEKKKWNAVKNKIPQVKEIYNNATSKGKVKKFIDQNLTKHSKKELGKIKEEYLDYIRFCGDNHLLPNSEHEQVKQLLDTTEIALLSPSERLDRELKIVCDEYDSVYTNLNLAGEELYSKRQNALDSLENVEKIVNSIASKPKSFEADITEVKIQKETFHKTIEYAKEQNKELKKAAIGIGTGAVAGATVAAVAPTAAIWVATTFGTASTGTAISALSGAAATNAALAWLGGGAVAAGGGGVAAGQALLALAGPIGWGVAGTSVIISVFVAWRKHQKILENKRDEIVRVKNCIESLQEIIGWMNAVSLKTDSLNSIVCQNILDSNDLQGVDYATLSDSQKQQLGTLVNNAKSLSALINDIFDKEPK